MAKSANTTVVNYIRVDERIDALGCTFPAGIAILPENFETAAARSDFIQRSEAATLKALFRNNEVPFSEILPSAEKSAYSQYNNLDWIAPAIFVSGSLLSQNPMAVSLALSVIGNYLTDFFRGIPGRKGVKIDIVIERRRDRSCKKITYEGDVQGLTRLVDIMRQISDE